MRRARKYRIYPNEKQKRQIAQSAGNARFVYNHFLARQEENHRNGGKYIPVSSFIKELPGLKKELPWLKEGESTSLQQAVRHLDRAYKNFFEKRAGKPDFKSRRACVQSYTCMKNGCEPSNIGILDEKHVKLPKLGTVRAEVHRELKDGEIITSATVSFNSAGEYYVSFAVEIPEGESQALPEDPRALGLDYSPGKFYVDSDGNTPGNPRYLKKYEKRIRRDQKAVSRKKKGSKNREKARRKLARSHRKAANCRLDFEHKLSRKLADGYDIIGVESLSLKGMAKKKKGGHFSQGKTINDTGWNSFCQMLAYKLAEHGGQLVKVGKTYPSSQLCHHCGYQNQVTKDLSVREITCPVCGHSYNRDINAAENIRDEALRLCQSKKPLVPGSGITA